MLNLKRIYITNQKKLAGVIGISRQHLSSVKNKKCGASDELIAELQRITQISVATWLTPSRKATLDRELAAYFETEKYAESLAIIKSQRGKHDSTATLRS